MKRLSLFLIMLHHAKLPKKFLEENKNCLKLVYLPLYSPNLNKIEELWECLKDSVVNNVFFHIPEEIQKAVQKFVDWVNTVPQMVIDRLCLQVIINHIVYRYNFNGFGKFLETIKNCSVLIKVIEDYILLGFMKFQKL